LLGTVLGEVSPPEVRRVHGNGGINRQAGRYPPHDPRATRAALKRMQARGAGTIVQVGSALAYRSIPLQSTYCSAKSALRGFTDSLRSELIHDGSRVHLTMVHLSACNTPQFDWGRNRMGRLAKPLGKIFQPEVAAEAIYWAAQQRRREIWVVAQAAQLVDRVIHKHHEQEEEKLLFPRVQNASTEMRNLITVLVASTRRHED
jgi:short-subunit dehydrogenase